MATEERSLATTSKRPAALSTSKTLPRKAAIEKIVYRVELGKHLKEKMDPAERAMLVNLLNEQPWEIEDIERRGDAVLKTDTYGSIGFDRWHTVEETFSREEMHKRALDIALKIIADRKKKFLELQALMVGDELHDALSRNGYETIPDMYVRRLDAEYHKTIDVQIERARKVEELIAGMTMTQKHRLAEILDAMATDGIPDWKKGLLKRWSLLKKLPIELTGALAEDPIAPQFIRLFAPLVMDEVEAMIKNSGDIK
jgi:hypothetical protein